MRRTSPRARRSAWWCEKCPGATSCTVIDRQRGRAEHLKPRLDLLGGQDSSGGVIQYQDGASGSAGALVEIIAIAQRRDSGASPTRHTPSFTGIRSRSRVNAIARSVQYRADEITPARSGWSFTSSLATSMAGPLRVDQRGRLVKPRAEPVPLGVGPGGERAEVHVDRLRGAEQRGRARPARARRPAAR